MNFPDRDDILMDSRGTWRKNLDRQGLWRATVVNVNDPQQRGRIQVRITLLHPASAPVGQQPDQEESNTLIAPPDEGVPDDACPWAEPCFPWGGFVNAEESDGLKSEGFFALPSVGSTVWVGFDQGFTGRPVWLGSWLTTGTVPEEVSDPANIRLFKTPAGHIFLFDDTSGSEKVYMATAATDSSGSPHTVRRIELNDSAKKLTITNTSDLSGDPRTLEQDETAKKTTLTEGTDRKLELDQTAKKTTLQQDMLQQIIQDGTTMTTTIKNSPTSTIVQNALAGTTIITEGAVTVTLGPAGVIAITNGAAVISATAAGEITVDAPGGQAINLGSGGSGVVIDALIALFNNHAHTITSGSSAGTTATAAASGHTMVAGTHTSTKVLAEPTL